MNLSIKSLFLSFIVAVVAIVSGLIFYQNDKSAKQFVIHQQNNDKILQENKLLSSSTSAILFGATSGICEALAIRLASAGVTNITIVGRNEKEGKRIINEMNEKSPKNKMNRHRHQFIPSDLMLLKNCNKLVTENEKLRANHENSLKFVVYCQTKATLQTRTETVGEGIDEKLALNFYSRMYLTKLLLPWMSSNKKHEQDGNKTENKIRPRFLSILSAGQHSPYANWKSDTRLSSPQNYGQKSAADITSFYTDLVFDKFAQQNPQVDFVHASPGFVNTLWGSDMPSAVRVAIRGMQAVAGRPAEQAAEFMLRPLIAPKLERPPLNVHEENKRGGNINNRKDDKDNKDENDDDNSNKKSVYLVDEFGNAGQVKKTGLHLDVTMEHVWKDTMELFKEVEAKF